MARHARPRQRTGRHRRSNPGLVHCRALPAVQAILTATQSGRLVRRPLRRHSWAWLTHSGGRPRSAFAVILSL